MSEPATTQVVSFRLHPSAVARLDELADELCIGRSSAASSLVLWGLKNHEQALAAHRAIQTEAENL